MVEQFSSCMYIGFLSSHFKWSKSALVGIEPYEGFKLVWVTVWYGKYSQNNLGCYISWGIEVFHRIIILEAYCHCLILFIFLSDRT